MSTKTLLKAFLFFYLNAVCHIYGEVRQTTFREFCKKVPDFSVTESDKVLVKPDKGILDKINNDLGEESKFYRRWFSAKYSSSNSLVYVMYHMERENEKVIYHIKLDSGEIIEKCLYIHGGRN